MPICDEFVNLEHRRSACLLQFAVFPISLLYPSDFFSRNVKHSRSAWCVGRLSHQTGDMCCQKNKPATWKPARRAATESRCRPPDKRRQHALLVHASKYSPEPATKRGRQSRRPPPTHVKRTRPARQGQHTATASGPRRRWRRSR